MNNRRWAGRTRRSASAPSAARSRGGELSCGSLGPDLRQSVRCGSNLAYDRTGHSDMAIDLFRLDPRAKTLRRVSAFSMESIHLTESNDLEAWLASCQDRLFGREILWIARQDRPSHEQRSDIIGVDKNGNLLIAELKRGVVEESAITQALGYTAEYKGRSVEDLQSLFSEQSAKAGQRVAFRRPREIRP